MDDSIVKSLTEEAHVINPEETFATLRKHELKLNPKRYVFKVKSGKFIGFMVREGG